MATVGSTTTGPTSSCTVLDGIPVGAECGLFVQPSTRGEGDCSQASPCASLGEAISNVTPEVTRIYVCAEALDEAVNLPAGVEIHGGIDCTAGWTWSSSGRTAWSAPADDVPLRFTGGAFESTVTGVDIVARDATQPGGSSIAVIADGGTLGFARASIRAGNGVNGPDGSVSAEGAPGLPGAEGGTQSNTSGGSGGTGGCNGGGSGAPIVCSGTCSAGMATDGQPGVAGGGGVAGTNGSATCSVGGAGGVGMVGDAGPGAVGIGTISEDGFTPAVAGPGGVGGPGGGGGGGGAKTSSLLGGGGGGSGGCGGEGSTPGTSGGASIAIVALDAVLTFDQVSVEVGFAGDGGIGGAGAPGGAGGLGGFGGCTAGVVQCVLPNAERGCRGGDGGVGGVGGVGGSGAGGHALIIAYRGVDPMVGPLDYTPPTSDQAGLGGPNASAGVAAVMLEFN